MLSLVDLKKSESFIGNIFKIQTDDKPSLGLDYACALKRIGTVLTFRIQTN